MAIKIKKSHKGLLHKNLGIKQGEKIPASKLKVKSTDSPAVKKRKIFAIQAKKWHHAQEGLTVPNQLDFPDVESYHNALDAYMAEIQRQDELTLVPGINSNNNPLQTSTSHFQDVLNQVPSTAQSFQNRNMSKPLTPSTKDKKKKFNIGNAALSALVLTDAVIPNDPIKKPVVRPLNSYNPHPYGTGSQAIAEEGLTLSTTGYKKNSKDKNKSKLRIPSNKITMKDVEFPVMGTDNLGNQQLMLPEQDYQFPGEYVDEVPLAKKGKKMKAKPYISTSYQKGGKVPSKDVNTGQYLNTPIGMNNGTKAPLPIMVDNPNDPRLKAYQDSLTLYNATKGDAEKLKTFSPEQWWKYAAEWDKSNPQAVPAAERLKKLNGKTPMPVQTITLPYREGDAALLYKKPIQPVVYQKSQQATPIKKGQPTYEDSLALYNRAKEAEKLVAAGKLNGMWGVDEYIRKAKNSEKTTYWNNGDINGIKAIGTKWVKTPNPHANVEIGVPMYKKPVGDVSPQPQEPKFKKAIAPDRTQLPNLVISNRASNIAAPNLQQAAFDASQPTKFAFTYPDYSQQGIDKQQKSMYFPDLQSLRSFGKQYGLEPQYGADNSWGQILAQNTPENLRKMDNGGSLSQSKAAEMLKDGTAHGKKLTAKQKKYFQAIAHGWQPTDKAGDGWLGMGYAANGLEIENNEYTPISDSTLQIGGRSHDNGGTNLMYAGKGVEAEAGETFHIDQGGNGVIMGNMKNPLTGKKFKQDSKMLAKKEKKVDKLLDYSTALVNNSNPYDKWDALKFNAGEAMMMGAKKKKDELQSSREHLGALQEAMLQLKQEGEDLSPLENKGRKKAKNGLKIDFSEKAQGGAFMYLLDRKNKTVDNRISSGRSGRKPASDLPTISLDAQDVYGTQTPDDGLSVAQKHNNPGNMKYEPWMSKFGATPGNPDKITGDGTTYAQFPDMQSGIAAMKERLFHRPTYSNLTLSQAINRWTGNKPYANIPQDLAGKKLNQMTPEEQERAFSTITLGEDSKVYNRIPPGGTTKPLESQTFTPQDIHFNPVTTPQFGNPQKPTRGPNVNPYEYNWNLTETPDIQAPTDAEPLQFKQILPELYAAATNKEQDVWMQKFNPQLFQPYQQSFQDRRNQVTSQGRASRQFLGDNANAQAILAAGEYDALSNIGADEFRTNQAISQDITNKNIALLNDASLKNLELADRQYVRQSTAKSKTKAANQDILNSISNKVLQNQLENRTLQVYENLYPHFRYNDQYQLKKEGNSGGDYLNVPSFNPSGQSTGNNTSTTQTMDANGNLKQIKYSTPSTLKTSLDEIRLKEAREKAFGGEYTNLQKLFNLNKK